MANLFKKRPINSLLLYVFVIILGITAGFSESPFLHVLGQVISDIFIKLFKCISIPIIALSIIVTLSNHFSAGMNQIVRRTAFYTLTTTLIAATISCGLYLLIHPANVGNLATISELNTKTHVVNYWQYIISLIPENFISPFIDSQIISILLIGIVVGIAIRFIPDKESKQTVIHFFKGMHALLFIITKWIIAILPIGLFGFITTSALQIHEGVNISGIGSYLAIIVLANLIQGFLILPLWLRVHGIAPFKTMRAMLPALSVAFFSKSSAGTLPITMTTMERNLNINPKVSRFVLPLCTSINMNGCAAFIFTTVIFLMQNHGVDISLSTMVLWIIISTVAAIGNAGVPMGCFFLSASLLASMNVPINLMGVILPFYGVIDMLETTLNVWSDSCVTKMVDHKNQVGDPLEVPASVMV